MTREKNEAPFKLERLILKQHGEALIDGKSISLSAVSSIQVVEKRPSSFWAGLLVGLGIVVILSGIVDAFAGAGWEALAYLPSGAALIAGGEWPAHHSRPTFRLTIAGPAGEQEVMESNSRQEIEAYATELGNQLVTQSNINLSAGLLP